MAEWNGSITTRTTTSAIVTDQLDVSVNPFVTSAV